MHSMEPPRKVTVLPTKPNQPKSLVELCIKTLHSTLPEHCKKLSEAIEKKYTNDLKNPNSISKEKALSTLIEISREVKEESDWLRITPISTEIKVIPKDVLNKFPSLLGQLTAEILPRLKENRSGVVHLCTQLVVVELYKNGNWQKHDLFKEADPVLITFIQSELKAYSQFQIKKYEAAIQWCP